MDTLFKVTSLASSNDNETKMATKGDPEVENSSSDECVSACTSYVPSDHNGNIDCVGTFSDNHNQAVGSGAVSDASVSAGSGGPRLYCPKHLDHTHPLLGGLPLSLGPRPQNPRRSLTLDERIRVIELYDAGMSARKIADDFGVGKTQIQNTLKKKDEYLTDFANSVSGETKRRARKSPNDQINELCKEWFRECTAEGLHVTGPMVREKALQIAGHCGIQDFKASNGWLDSFLKRSGIRLAGMRDPPKKYGSHTVSSLLCMKRNLDPDEESAETNSKRLKLIHGSLDDGVADVSGETSPAGFWENLTGSAVDLHLQNIQPQAELASVSDSHQALPADAVRETVPKLSKRSTGSLGDDKETSENVYNDKELAPVTCVNTCATMPSKDVRSIGPALSIKTEPEDISPTDISSESTVNSSEKQGEHETLVSSRSNVGAHALFSGDFCVQSGSSPVPLTTSTSSCTAATSVGSSTVVRSSAELSPPLPTSNCLTSAASTRTSPDLERQGDCWGKSRELSRPHLVYCCHLPVPPPFHNIPPTTTDTECAGYQNFLTTQDVLDVADESLHTEAASSQQHGDVLLNNMYQLWRDGRLLDLQLDINGITVWVHKLVVLGLSPYAGLIMAGLQNEKVNCLKIQVPQPVHRSSVAALIIYLYTGRLVLNYCTVLALKCIGEALRMTYLQKLCSTYLSNCKHLAESCIRTSNTVTLPETLMYKQPEEDKRGDVLPVTGSAKRKCRKPLMMSQGVTSDPPQKYASLASGQCDEGIRPKDAVTQKHVAKTMQSCKTEKTEDMSDCHAVNPPESEILDLSKSGEHRDMCTADERTYEYRHAHAQEPECVADSAPVGDNVHAADPPARGDAKVPDTISGNRR